jgi:hypothetical protein
MERLLEGAIKVLEALLDQYIVLKWKVRELRQNRFRKPPRYGVKVEKLGNGEYRYSRGDRLDE